MVRSSLYAHLSLMISVIFVSSVPGTSTQDLLPDRDEWYDLPQLYTSHPRVFDLSNGCPEKTFYLDCNICSCKEKYDANPQCTFIQCPPRPQIVNWGNPGVKCPPGKAFFWKCNDCSCDETGDGAICTRKYCPDFSMSDEEES